jgi:hypothetical protein
MALLANFPIIVVQLGYMTKLLDQAIAQVRELPDEQQDAVAANLINLIDDRLSEDEERDLTENH